MAGIAFDLLPTTAHAQITPTIYVDPPSIIDPTKTPGCKFTINVNVTDIIDLHSWQVHMDWTPGLIDALTVTYGDFIQKDKFSAPPYINNTEGVCVFGQITLGLEGTDGSGWLATVEFEVKGIGETNINIDDPELTYLLDSTWPDSQPILFTPLNGYFSNQEAAGDFSLSASPNTLTIQQGSSGTSTITVTSISTFDSPVSLTASGLPTDVTVSFSPNMVTPPAGSSTTSTLTFAASASATVGTATVTVTGTSTTPSLTHSTTTSLTINGSHLPRYDLTVSVVGSGTTDPGPGVYTCDEGTVVSVDAIPDAGWMLDSWKLDGVDVGSAVSYSITVDAGHTLTAVFSETVSDVTKPVANAGQDQTVTAGASVSFDAGGSSDNVGIISYDWAFGDGATGTGKTTTHTYINSGTYTVTLTVKDAANNSATHTITVTVLPAPPPAEVFPMWIIGAALAVIGAVVVAALLLRRRK